MTRTPPRVLAAIAVLAVALAGCASRAPDPTPDLPAPAPLPPGFTLNASAPWWTYERTLGATGVRNVSLAGAPRGGVLVAQFVEYGPGGVEAAWNESISTSSARVLATTNGRVGAGASGFDPAVGDATWLFLPAGLGEGARVPLGNLTLVLSPGDALGAPAAWAACAADGEGRGNSSSCFFYDRATGWFVGSRAEGEPGWRLRASSDEALAARVPID